MKHLLLTLFLIGAVHAEPIKINLVTTNDIHGMISSQTANFMNPQYPPTILGGAAFSNMWMNYEMKLIKQKKECSY